MRASFHFFNTIMNNATASTYVARRKEVALEAHAADWPNRYRRALSGPVGRPMGQRKVITGASLRERLASRRATARLLHAVMLLDMLLT